MRSFAIAVLVGLLAWVGWFAARSGGGRSAAVGEPLTILCAASNRGVMEAVRRDYERDFGIPVHVQYGPSQTLLTALEVGGTGDLFLPADESYLDLARERHLVREIFPLATMQAVAVVRRGNPKGITSLNDLLRDDVRVAMASPETSAIGTLSRAALAPHALWEPLERHAAVSRTAVNEVANDVAVGAVDAGIVFDAVLHDYPDLQAVPLPELRSAEARVAVSITAHARRPARAIHFARYLSSRDKGLVTYAAHGFRPVEGDVWSDAPEVVLYAGSMLRPAIERSIVEFEEREGVTVTRVYNGCGILVSQMQAGRLPDAYFACDVEFMKHVESIFTDIRDISRNELVILVQPGNPHGIATLRDLARPGLRVGIGHEKQCAMGWLTQRTFAEDGVTGQVMPNVVVQAPTGDMLVNQMRSGALDAAVVYLSNAAGAGDAVQAVRIHGLACAMATQPLGVRKDSGHRQTIARLVDTIRAAASRERFVREGFRWVDEEESP